MTPRATVSVSRREHPEGQSGLVWSINLTTLGVVLSVLIGTITLGGLLYAGLRTAIHPLVVEEVEKGIAQHVEKFDAPAHARIEAEVNAARDERMRQLSDLKGDVQYIRERVDQIADRQSGARTVR